MSYEPVEWTTCKYKSSHFPCTIIQTHGSMVSSCYLMRTDPCTNGIDSLLSGAAANNEGLAAMPANPPAQSTCCARVKHPKMMISRRIVLGFVSLALTVDNHSTHRPKICTNPDDHLNPKSWNGWNCPASRVSSIETANLICKSILLSICVEDLIKAVDWERLSWGARPSLSFGQQSQLHPVVAGGWLPIDDGSAALEFMLYISIFDVNIQLMFLL